MGGGHGAGFGETLSCGYCYSFSAQTHLGVDKADAPPGHAVMGIGGSTEGALAAAALKALGGSLQARLWRRDAGVRARGPRGGGEEVFVAATSVTTGLLLRGVAYHEGGAVTESLVIRARSSTARWIVGEHRLEKLERFAGRSTDEATSALPAVTHSSVAARYRAFQCVRLAPVPGVLAVRPAARTP